MSSNKILPLLAMTLFVSSTAFATESCDRQPNSAYHQSMLIVDSLRAEKPGQARVFAYDGTEFTGGQSQWLHGQMRVIDRACARGDQATAARVLADVQQLVHAHQKRS